MKNDIYILEEDRTWNGEEIIFCAEGTENYLLEWIHKYTSYSFDYALKQGGYTMKKK